MIKKILIIIVKNLNKLSNYYYDPLIKGKRPTERYAKVLK